jgi:cell wall-associated NlpC family hydrolase
MRKAFIAAAVALTATLAPATAQAAPGPIIELNGEVLPVEAKIVENRTLVPLRGVLEALGAQVAWDGEHRLVTATLGKSVIQLQIGAAEALVNGTTVPLDVPARIDAGSTYIPVRFMAENLGARVGYDATSRRVRIEARGFTVSRDAIAAQEARNAARLQTRLVETARSLLGSPYAWGGTTPAGFDCSGFTGYVYRQAGIELPRSSDEQFTIGRPVKLTELQPGDLLFWDIDGTGSPSHVGMYIGDGLFIHAENAHRGVVTTEVNRAWWVPRYLGARRVLPAR